jgi:hypothetical protein
VHDAHSQRTPGPTRRPVTTALALLLLACLLSTAREAIQAPNLNSQKAAPDEVSARSDRRFSELRQSLPGTGVVGYMGEPGPSAIPDYYLAQYALAPLVVDQSTNHPLVIGNFPSSPQPAIPGDATSQLKLIRDFGNGVMLFAKEGAR